MYFCFIQLYIHYLLPVNIFPFTECGIFSTLRLKNCGLQVTDGIDFHFAQPYADTCEESQNSDLGSKAFASF